MRSFVYRELPPMGKIARPLFATHDFSITFNLTGQKFGFIKPVDNDSFQSEVQLDSEIVISGIASQFGGIMTSDGYSRLFSIYFTPTGFFRIFGIPANLFTNIIEEDAYACNNTLRNLREQLLGAGSTVAQISYCEKYLLQQLASTNLKDNGTGIMKSAAQIVDAPGLYSVEQMAYDANMSMKTFERKFIVQVGSSPKLYSRIVRFNKAIALKMNNIQKSWTTIAHASGYFDQMHFIKDFKFFTGTTPTDFFKYMPPVAENYND